jgi:DNA-binding response OmpR family regulator
MDEDRLRQPPGISFVELFEVDPPTGRYADEEDQAEGDPRFSYRMKLGRQTIRLEPVEFRILQFLAARPYQAFSRQRIAEAVSTPRQPVAADVLDQHISRLRHALGFFHDYIQSVPAIGYRFRA